MIKMFVGVLKCQNLHKQTFSTLDNNNNYVCEINVLHCALAAKIKRNKISTDEIVFSIYGTVVNDCDQYFFRQELLKQGF